MPMYQPPILIPGRGIDEAYHRTWMPETFTRLLVRAGYRPYKVWVLNRETLEKINQRVWAPYAGAEYPDELLTYVEVAKGRIEGVERMFAGTLVTPNDVVLTRKDDGGYLNIGGVGRVLIQP